MQEEAPFIKWLRENSKPVERLDESGRILGMKFLHNRHRIPRIGDWRMIGMNGREDVWTDGEVTIARTMN